MLFSALIIYKPENGSESPVSDSKRMSHSSHLGITPGACYGSVASSNYRTGCQEATAEALSSSSWGGWAEESDAKGNLTTTLSL